MKFDPIVLSVPMYFLLMGVEAWIDRRRGAGLYRLHDALTNLSCGVFQTLLTALLVLPLGAPYRYVYEHARVTEVFARHPGLAWAVAFVGADFFYYWFHRWSHESAVGWFSHVVHHQSEDYNLSVALRQDGWQPLFSLWFQVPLALLGVPPEVFVSAYGVVIVYQFWIHTRLIDRMGPLEWVFNTPSHHRVHHGVDPKYLDKNYAGVFIVWDRLFGTFQNEEEAPTYGTIEPVRSWNPSWVHVQYGVKLVDKMRAARTTLDALQVLVRGPGWQPPGAPAEDLIALAAARRDVARYDVAVDRRTERRAVIVFVAGMVAAIAVLGRNGRVTSPVDVALAALSLWALTNVGGALERRAWFTPSQRALGAAVVGLSAALALNASPAWAALALVGVALALVPAGATVTADAAGSA